MTLQALGISAVQLRATGAGDGTVLVRWTRFWRVTAGIACIGPSPDGWTAVRVFAPGPVTIAAKVGLGALAGGGSGGSCSPGAH
jgi:hypothetical protein